MRLRRIEIWLEDTQDSMVFVTNHLKLHVDVFDMRGGLPGDWCCRLFWNARSTERGQGAPGQ